jgi:hypothetical protein
MATLAFTTAVKSHEPIEFELDGEAYHFTPPKTARITLAALKIDGDNSRAAAVGLAVIDWMSDGLPDEEAKRLELRLNNPEDDFDIPDLVKIADALMARVSGRPFGSLLDSSPSPQNDGKPLTPEPSSVASTPSTSP